VWPDNWNLKTPQFQQDFIRSHLQDAVKIRKPFVLEECAWSDVVYLRQAFDAALSAFRFGKITEEPAQRIRNQYYESAYAVAEADVTAKGPLMGTLFWHWYDAGIGPGQYGVHITDSTWPIITQHVSFMNNAYMSAPDICPA